MGNTVIEILCELPGGNNETLEVEVGIAQRIGLDGAVGPQGPQGIPGEPGPQGEQGEQGIQGIPGRDGTNGVDGAPGRDGANGADGRDGENGRDGANGTDGVSVTGAAVNGVGNLEIRLSDGRVVDAGRVATDTAARSNPMIPVDPQTVKTDTYLDRIWGHTLPQPTINISDYIPVTPGHTYKMYLTDKSFGQFYDSYYLYESVQPYVYSRPAGSDTLVDEVRFRAAENEHFLMVVTKLPMTTDFAHAIAIEDITEELDEPGKTVNVDYKGASSATLDYETYRRENGLHLVGNAKNVGVKASEKLGIIDENGGFIPEPAEFVVKEFCRTLAPVYVGGYSHIRVTPKNGGKVPAYFSCYSGDNFSGFLGRTGGTAWSEIGNYADRGYVVQLPAGTNYISAVTYYDAVKTDVYHSTEITAFNGSDVRFLAGGYEIPISL